MHKKEPTDKTASNNCERSQTSVSLMSLEHVIRAHPDTFREALRRISRERQPMQWAAEQLKLGASLRLQSRRESGFRRIQSFRQVVEAFESALFIYCRCISAPERPLAARTPGCQIRESDELNTPADAIEVVLEVSSRPMLSGPQDLDGAISVLEDNTSDAVRRADYAAWVMNMINLGCTLTLAGKYESAAGDVTRLEKAVDTFHVILGDPKIAGLPFERALAHINLAEAFCSMGEVSSHDEHVAFLEGAVQALASALSLVAPDEEQRLVRADPRTFV